MILFNPFKDIIGGFMGRHTDGLGDFGFSVDDLFLLEQVHGSEIIEIKSRKDAVRNHPRRGDAVLSTIVNVPIAVKSADCVPVLLAHPAGVIAAVHAGWRGTASGVLAKTLRKMKTDYGLDLGKIRAAIGPAICGDCYEVGGEVAKKFSHFSVYGNVRPTKKEKYRLDLRACNREEAIREGLSASQITMHEVCTRCRFDDYYSYREATNRDLQNAGRNYSWLCLIH